MIQSNYTVQVIQPVSGYLTQKNDVEVTARIFSKKIFLAVTDSADNYREIDEVEYQAYQEELKALEEAEKEGE